MIKIVYLISTLQKTGPTNILAGIVSHLDRKVYEPYVITLSEEKDPANSWITELAEQNVPIITLNLPRYRLDLLKRRIRQEISKIHPDLVHAQCFRSALLSACLLGNCKRVATVHCDFQEDFVMAYGKLMGKVMAWLYAKALKKMDCRICCSRMLAVLLEKKFPNMHFAYVDNGVDTDKFYPVSDKQTLRKKLGLPEDKTIFIWAGAFISRKDPMSWVQAVKKQKHSKAFFLFCGEGPLRASCQKELHAVSDALFIGHTPRLQEYLRASDIYVSSSLSEGLPCAVLEALACGKTLLLTDIPSHRYIFTEDKGSLVQKQNSEQLYQQMQKIKRPSFLLEQERHKDIQERFSCRSMSVSYQGIYSRLIGIQKEKEPVT